MRTALTWWALVGCLCVALTTAVASAAPGDGAGPLPDRELHVNGDALFNRAVASLEAGHRGEAVAALLAARELLPRDAGVHDLLADTLAGGGGAEAGACARMPDLPWFALLSPRDYGWLLLAALLGGGTMMAAGILRPLPPGGWRARLSAACLPPLLVAGLMGLRLESPAWTAAVKAGTALHTGPDRQNTVLATVTAGCPLQPLAPPRAGFVLVAMADGVRGWVALEDLAPAAL